MASPDCTNIDISGIGVRTATYAQNLLSFVPAFVALINDGKISHSERAFIRDQSTNILLTAFGLLLSAMIQARPAEGLDNYHVALVLNLSWMNNTNTFIYLLLCIHRKIWSSPLTKWSWWEIFRRLFRQSSTESQPEKSAAERSAIADESAPGEQQPADKPAQGEPQLAQGEPETLLDLAVWIGSLHLSLMGAVGIWLWINPVDFSFSRSCPGDPTISVLGHTLSMASPVLRVISLVLYFAVLIPIVNLVLPTALILMPYFLCPLDKFNPKKREVAAERCVACGLGILFLINCIFIIDTELSISQNELRQAGQDRLWTLGQTLALLLIVLPILALIRYLVTTTSLVLPFVGQTQWSRAMNGFRQYDPTVNWSEVYRWRWLIGDTPVKVDNDWLLHALIDGQRDLEYFLCENGASLGTVMEIAANQGKLEIVRFLITRGVDVDSKYGAPLRGAAEQGHLRIVHTLVHNGAELDDNTPLFLAAQHGHLSVVQFLVEKGVDVNGYDPPLNPAAGHGHAKIVRFLVEHGATVDVESLCAAAAGGHLEIVRFLVENGAEVNDTHERQTPLNAAVGDGHREIVKFLIRNGANVTAHDLVMATWEGHLDILRILIPKVEDAHSHKLLDIAAKKDHWDIVRFLVEKSTQVNDIYHTPLYRAAGQGRSDIVQLLVQKGVDINQNYGRPLYWAARYGHADIVRVLVKKGADVDLHYPTPLYVAAMEGHSDIVHFLIRNNANVNSRYLGETPLDVATRNKHTGTVSLLRARNARRGNGFLNLFTKLRSMF